MKKINLENSQLEELCKEVRADMFNLIKNSKSGHLGGCSSSTEMMVSLYFAGLLNYDVKNPFDEKRDNVLVRGHLGPLRYKIFSMLGWVDEKELKNYRKLGSILQGHESMDLVPGVDITPSGSLGMLLSYGVGSAISSKTQKKDSKTYVFLGDGEEQEGNVSEAARHASKLGLDNLICIIDKNKKQLSHPTSDVDNGDIYKIWKGYGWEVNELEDGHDFQQIKDVFNSVQKLNNPSLIIANTIKGKYLEGCEKSINGYHTLSSCPLDNLENSIKNIKVARKEIIKFPIQNLIPKKKSWTKTNINILPPTQDMELEDATDIYLKEVEKELGKRGIRFYIMTADLMDHNYINSFDFSPTTQFIDVGIREQHLFSSAYGISITDPNSRIWIHSGDSFLYRASDQLNAISQGKGSMLILGDRPGLGGGKNGPTHQSSGQPGTLLTMPGINFLEPADIDDLFGCFNKTLNEYSSPTYIRLHPDKINRLPSVEKKNLENYIVFDPKEKPDINLIGSGLAMKHVLQSAKDLEKEGINAKVINVINLKNLDQVFKNKLEPKVPILTLYNGNPFILKSAVATSIMESEGPKPSKIYSHGFEFGTSGKLEDLLNHFGYDKLSIKNKIRNILK
ncbi:hypothetical protein HOD29_02035 [archaeon]|jgi:transketolase|nr:hypothetical protein [archaeon]